MKEADMEKIIVACKQLIPPREKDDTHLDSHKQINELFELILIEFRNVYKKYDELVKIVKNADNNTNLVSEKFEKAKGEINTIIANGIKEMKIYVSERTQKESYTVKYQGSISTKTQDTIVLDPIIVKTSGPYRAEVSVIRKSLGNENIQSVTLPTVVVFEGQVSPQITITSKGGEAVYEYEFDVLVTKL